MSANEPAAKKRKLGPDCVPEMVGTESIEGTKLITVALSNLKGKADVSVYLGNSIYLANTGTDVLKISRGTVLLGYGKIGWGRVKSGGTPGPKEIPFVLENSESMVMVGNSLTTVGSTMEDRSSKLSQLAIHHPFPRASRCTVLFGARDARV